MKITDVKAYPLKTRTALVRVFTDDGVEGLGECSPMNVQVMCHFVATVLRPLVLGKSPLDVERLWDAMYFGTYKLGTEGTQPSAISGVDIALWDIKAKVAGMPLLAAIRQGRKLEELGAYHFEEPVAPTNYAGIRAVADALDVPVSAGEHEYTRWQFRDLILEARPDLLQPDVVKALIS